ncbi:MAG: hypothetical protein WAR83_04000 [Flavobacteriales bacterium]
MHFITHLFALFLRAIGKGIQHWTADPEKAKYAQGSVTLVMPRSLAVIGVAFILLSAYALYSSFPLEHTPVAGMIIIILFCSAIAIPGILALMDVRNHRVLMIGDNCYVTDIRGRTKAFAWNEVLRVRPGSNSSLMRIELKDDCRIKVSPFLLGFSVLNTALVDAIDKERGAGVDVTIH